MIHAEEMTFHESHREGLQHENKKILTAILVTVLIISNAYFIYESQKSKPLTEKEDRNTVLFSLLQARSIEKPKIMEQLADAVIMIGDPQAGISYAQITLWVDESSIIAETGDED